MITDRRGGWPHLLVSGFNCNPEALADLTVVHDFLKRLPDMIGMKLLGPPVVYRVTEDVHPDIGVTGVSIITTSHISIHTFPKGQKSHSSDREWSEKIGLHKPFFTFDCYSCKMFDCATIFNELTRTFSPADMETGLLYRLRESGAVITENHLKEQV